MTLFSIHIERLHNSACYDDIVISLHTTARQRTQTCGRIFEAAALPVIFSETDEYWLAWRRHDDRHARQIGLLARNATLLSLYANPTFPRVMRLAFASIWFMFDSLENWTVLTLAVCVCTTPVAFNGKIRHKSGIRSDVYCRIDGEWGCLKLTHSLGELVCVCVCSFVCGMCHRFASRRCEHDARMRHSGYVIQVVHRGGSAYVSKRIRTHQKEVIFSPHFMWRQQLCRQLATSVRHEDSPTEFSIRVRWGGSGWRSRTKPFGWSVHSSKFYISRILPAVLLLVRVRFCGSAYYVSVHNRATLSKSLFGELIRNRLCEPQIAQPYPLERYEWKYAGLRWMCKS